MLTPIREPFHNIHAFRTDCNSPKKIIKIPFINSPIIPAQGILDARAKYPDCSLADLYDEVTMPPELRKAHQANDRAVMNAYGFAHSLTEPEIVAELMSRYQKLTASAK